MKLANASKVYGYLSNISSSEVENKHFFEIQQVFNQIEDFGEAFAEEANVFMSPGGLNSTISETSGSIFSEPHVHEAIDRELSQMNNDGQNGESGERNPSDVSCETIPPSLPTRQDAHTDRIRILTKKAAIVASGAAPAIRGNIQPSLKAVNDKEPSPRVANQFPTSLIVDNSTPSQPEDLDIFTSQSTNDRNGLATPAAFSNVVNIRPVPRLNGDIPMHQDGIENARPQPDDDIQTEPEAYGGGTKQGRDGNVRTQPNGNILPETELEPETIGDVTMQESVDNIQAWPDVDIPTGAALPASPIAAEIANPAANAFDIIEPLPVKLEPVDIAPPLLEVSQAVNISPKRQRRAASKKKNRVPRFDETITLELTEMRSRLEIATIDCLPPQSHIISKAERLFRKEAAFFMEPTIVGQGNRQLFKRNLIQFDEENDLSIIHAILDIAGNDRSRSVEEKEQESHVIEGDTVRRRSSRKRKSPVVVPHEQPGTTEIEEAGFPSPLNAMDGSDLQIPEPSAQQIPENIPTRADASLSDNDKMLLRKLKALWKQNVHPIAMANINSPKDTRLQAAKNFASILCKIFILRLHTFPIDQFCFLFHSAQKTAIGRSRSE